MSIEHGPDCRPEDMSEPDEEGMRDCRTCGLWEKQLERRGLDNPYLAIDGQEVYFSIVHDSWVVRWSQAGEDYSENITEWEASELVHEYAKAKRLEHENTVRSWAFNSERLNITLGICGNDQEGSFGNATLQGTGNDPALEFSVAVHVEVPADITNQEDLADYLGRMFGDIVHRWPVLHVEVQLGLDGDGEEVE